MASQDKLRAMFNEMNLEQKGNFISNLKNSLEGSEDIESLQFLDECIGHYTMEKDYEDSLKEEAAEETVTDSTSPEPEIEAVSEPETEPEAEAEPELETEAEAEPEPEVEAEADVEPEPEPESEAEVEPESESDSETEMEVESEPEIEAEAEVEPESEAEIEPELELEVELEPDAVLKLEPEQEIESVEVPQAAPTVAKSKVDFIEMEISELANNIRHKMCVIETISHLLSDKGSEIMETITQANDLEYVLPLDSTKAYEEKVESTELCLSDFAESIRRDIKVIEAISNLLSGS
ncbi:MAG: hypothetical protein FWE83_07710 [Oscillospiraceae bacterium]|nr:hypothetical protein [Oscillospiraceae bacterium]